MPCCLADIYGIPEGCTDSKTSVDIHKITNVKSQKRAIFILSCVQIKGTPEDFDVGFYQTLGKARSILTYTSDRSKIQTQLTAPG
jgi:hypothetical protein